MALRVSLRVSYEVAEKWGMRGVVELNSHSTKDGGRVSKSSMPRPLCFPAIDLTWAGCVSL